MSPKRLEDVAETEGAVPAPASRSSLRAGSLLPQLQAKVVLGAAISIFTSPLQVAGATLQISSPAQAPAAPLWAAGLSAPEKETLKLLIQRQVVAFIDVREPPRYTTYKAVFRSLGHEGIAGFYKGNLTALAHSSLCFTAKLLIFSVQPWPDHLFLLWPLAASTLVDAAFQPLRMAQTRLIAQKACKNLRVYSGAAAALAAGWRNGELFNGWRALLPLNALQTLAFAATSGARPDAALLVATAALHVLGYPLTLAARRMEAASACAGGRKDADRSMAGALKNCVREGGFRGLYRGFLAHTGVNAALLFVSIGSRGQQPF